jgi:hypothetical protein
MYKHICVYTYRYNCIYITVFIFIHIYIYIIIYISPLINQAMPDNAPSRRVHVGVPQNADEAMKKQVPIILYPGTNPNPNLTLTLP